MWLPRRYLTHLLGVSTSQVGSRTLFYAFAQYFSLPGSCPDAILRVCSTFGHPIGPSLTASWTLFNAFAPYYGLSGLAGQVAAQTLFNAYAPHRDVPASHPRWPPGRYLTHFLQIRGSRCLSPRWLPRRYFTHLLCIVASEMPSLRGHIGGIPDGFPDGILRFCSTFRPPRWHLRRPSRRYYTHLRSPHVPP